MKTNRESNKDEKTYKSWAEIFLILITIVLVLYLWNIYPISAQVRIIDSAQIKSIIDSTTIGSWEKEKSSDEISKEITQKIISNLEKNRSILTPDEFASRITSYYNSIITVFSALVVIIGLVNFINAKTIVHEKMQEEIKKISTSPDFQKQIVELINGKLEESTNVFFENKRNEFVDYKKEIEDLLNEKFNENKSSTHKDKKIEV